MCNLRQHSQKEKEKNALKAKFDKSGIISIFSGNNPLEP